MVARCSIWVREADVFRVMRWVGVVTLLFILGFVASCNLGLPPLTWIEKGRFVAKAEEALATVSSPMIPPGITGDIFSYQDGWLVILYGQSVSTGHNLWNYNVAKDSTGAEYVSERHFCSSIKSRYDTRQKSDAYYLKSNPSATTVPNLSDPEYDAFKSLVESGSLAEGTKVFLSLGFTKRGKAD